MEVALLRVRTYLSLWRTRRSVRPRGVVKGLQGTSKGQPEGTKGSEDHGWEGVSKDEFREATGDHQYTPEEEVGCRVGRS